jgi:hypothetical protein
MKGAVSCYTTKLFEGLHRTLKIWWALRTNFKNVESQVTLSHFFTRLETCFYLPLQILRTETWALAAAIIQSDIDMLNEPESLAENEPSIGDYGNVTLGGSLRGTITFADIEISQKELEAQRNVPGAFQNFRKRFSVFFDNLLRHPESGFSLEHQPMDPISVQEDETVRFMSGFVSHLFTYHKSDYRMPFPQVLL